MISLIVTTKYNTTILCYQKGRFWRVYMYPSVLAVHIIYYILYFIFYFISSIYIIYTIMISSMYTWYILYKVIYEMKYYFATKDRTFIISSASYISNLCFPMDPKFSTPPSFDTHEILYYKRWFISYSNIINTYHVYKNSIINISWYVLIVLKYKMKYYLR